MKTLIIGSSGALGRELFNYLKIKKMNIYNNGLIKRKLNLTLYKNSLSILKKIKPEIIINCTGLTNIDQCEKDKKLAISVHKNLLNNIFKAKKKLKLKTFMIHFSTDHIYDNKNGRLNNEKQRPVLNNFYSKSKITVKCKQNIKKTLINREFFCRLIPIQKYDFPRKRARNKLVFFMNKLSKNVNYFKAFLNQKINTMIRSRKVL